MSRGLTKDAMLFALPGVLKDDPVMFAIAQTAADMMQQENLDAEQLMLYQRIDTLPEEYLDRLAYDFKIDWWEQAATLKQKREAVKTHWKIHKILGTRRAVEIVVSLYFGEGHVEEWFEYGGEPLHFRITTTNNTAVCENYEKFLYTLDKVKRAAAILDHVTCKLWFDMAVWVTVHKRVSIRRVAMMDAYTYLTDEQGRGLADEHGRLLIWG